jgi:predicted transcriptional regulator
MSEESAKNAIRLDLPPEEAARRVRLMRNVLRLTQGELGTEAGVNTSRISLFETAGLKLDDKELKRLRRTLERKLKAAYGNGREAPLSTLLNGPEREAVREDSLPDTRDIRQRRFSRLQTRLSQQRLATKIGIGQSKLSRWEGGQVELTKSELASWHKQIALNDPWFRLRLETDAGQELTEKYKKVVEENATLKAELMSAEVTSALRAHQLEELNERLQDPTIKTKG